MRNLSKSETVLELQELLKDMRSITVDLNRSISSLKEILDVEEFIPTSLGEKIRTYLEKINEKQTEFVSKYEALNSREPNTKYVVLENELEEAKKVFEENDRYVNGIKFFLSLHSDDEKTENILQNRKNTLNNLNIDAMERDDLQSLGKPYIWLQEAFWEIDAKKKFSLMYRLASCFEEEIAMGIQFGTLSIKEPNDEVLNVEITNNSFEKGAVELDTSESPVDETEKDENNYVVKNESKESEMEEPELVDNVAGKEYEGILVKEKPFILHVQMSSKAETKFGVKEFRNDIIKQYPKEKLECMVEALKGCGYSIKSITEKKNGKAESYKLSTEKLYQFGYLKRYVVDKMGEFFTLSPRGERAFVAKDSLSFINQNIKEKVSSQDDGEPIEDTANSSIVRLLSFDSSIKQRKLVPDYEFVIRMNVMATDYFVEGYPGKDSDITNWFAGIVTENVEQLQEFKETVNDKVNPGDVLIVTGNTLEQAETVANWLLSEFTLELRNIGYTTLFENSVYDIATKEPILFETKESIENDENLTAEPPILKEKKEKQQSEDETVSLEESENTGENKTIGKNGVAENESSSEETRLLKEIVIEAEETGGNRSYKATTKTVNSAVPSILEEEKKKYISTYQKMIVSGKTYAASAYLKALAKQHPYFEPFYRQLAYAVNDPMERCTYSSDTIFNVFYGDTVPISDYYIVAAALRNYFFDQYSYDYSIQQLYSMLSETPLFKENPNLEKVVYDLMTFKNEQHKGVDCYAEYREKERGSWEKRLAEIRREAKGYYENYGNGNLKENASHKRFIETTKLLLGTGSDLCEYLKVVSDDDRDMLDMLKDFLAITYVKDQASICEENIDPAKINSALDFYWDLASQNMRVAKKTSDLMSSLRTNLYKKVYKVVVALCNYVSVMNSSFTSTEDTSLYAYKKIRTPLLNSINKSIEDLTKTNSMELSKESGKIVLVQTLRELEQRLSGGYKEGTYKYYYIDFLKSDKVLLDEDFLPILDEVLELPDFSIMSRIQSHCDENETDLSDRLQKIFAGDDDYGSASLILKYFDCQGKNLSSEEYEKYNIEKAIVYPLRDLENKRKEFIEDIELAQSYGQIDNTVENSKEAILQIMEVWYLWAIDTQNYGFFVKILEEFRKKIKNDAQVRAHDLQMSLDVYLKENGSWEEDELISKAVAQIRERIEQQNYAAAEDLLNRVITHDLDLDVTVQQEDYLEKFFDEYDINYRKTADSGATLKSLVNTTKANKDIKGGNRLLETWPRGAGVGESALKNLLNALGFNLEIVHKEESILGKIENYSVVLKRPQNGRKSNYKHPISVFGSEAEEKGFRVVCIFGKTDASRLIDIFKEVGNAKNTIVLLDYALTSSDRRILARKTKTDMSGKVFAVIDRVILVFLAKHYSETAINRMLMSIIMPFASYQPYIDKSADVMPPEIFIGRKYELEKIESPTGVNIVYGGRQLGKSALLRMARKDIDHDENGDRAILVDIKGNDYKAAAKKISAALFDEGILKEEHITDDWSELARDIKKCLRSSTDYIPYLLLLMDEADVFIESCESVGYRPFDALKDIQSIGSGRFKFVVAGLRNIVRFKREVALGNNSVLTHLESLTVKPFKSMEARELLEVALSYLGFRFPKDNDTEVLISTIFGTTNYFPGLLQLYCAKLIEAMRRDYAGYSESETPPYIVKKDHIKKVLAEQSLQQDIREKFFITLKVGEDDYYYIIALLVAYYYHGNKSQNGCSASDLIELADTYSIGKISAINSESLAALMEEMCELNVLQHTGDGRYRFTRHSFCQMMGTVQQIEDELMNYMED